MQHILDFLKTTPDQITVGRVPPVAISASCAIATRNAIELAVKPMYFAKGGVGEIAITRAELDALHNAGAKRQEPIYY